MIYVICAVRDRAVDSFGTPIFVTHVGQAIRSFTDEINNPKGESLFFGHPEDFDLYVLGSFDSDVGDVVADKPRLVCVGKDVSLKGRE